MDAGFCVAALDEAISASRGLGRTTWKRWSGYHCRSGDESKMNCIKLLGQSLMAKDFGRRLRKSNSALRCSTATPFLAYPKNAGSWPLLSFFRSTARPAASAPWTCNTFFARLSPAVVIPDRTVLPCGSSEIHLGTSMPPGGGQIINNCMMMIQIEGFIPLPFKDFLSGSASWLRSATRHSAPGKPPGRAAASVSSLTWPALMRNRIGRFPHRQSHAAWYSYRPLYDRSGGLWGRRIPLFRPRAGRLMVLFAPSV